MRRWRCVECNSWIQSNKERWTVGRIYETDDDGKNLKSDDGDGGFINIKLFNMEEHGVKFEEVTCFTKSDLEECDVVHTRDGWRFVYFDDSLFKCNTSIPTSISMHNYHNDLTCMGFKDGDIMEVYRNKQLVYKREEKSASQLKVEELEKTIAKAMEQIDEIKKENGYDN